MATLISRYGVTDVDYAIKIGDTVIKGNSSKFVIRELSSPPLYDFDNADDYIVRLKNNFETIGKLAAENREMLDNLLFPILDSDQKLSDEMVEDMSDLSDKLLSLAEEVTSFENLDLPIMTMVSDRP